jgi:DNA modification methylase
LERFPMSSATTPSEPLHCKLSVEYLPLDALTLDPQNARLNSTAQIKQIAASIKAFEYNVPVLVDRNGMIVAGHGRYLACRELGRTEIPVIRLEHLTPEQARAFAIADNRLAENATWDEVMLAEHFIALDAVDLDFSLDVTGFSVGEIDLMIQGDDADAQNDPADDLPPIGPAVAAPGDLWMLGPHAVLCGDALDEGSYEALMGADRAAMVFTDPPYNVPIDGHVSGKGKVHHREFAMAAGEMTEAEFTAFLAKACGLMAKVSTDGALHYVCMDWRHLFALLTAGRTAYDSLLNICVWAKPNGGMGGLYRSAHELVLVFKHGRASHRNNVQLGRFGRNRTNVWSYPGANGFGHGEDADLTAQHPTPKPARMVADAILDVTARRDIVLDPFLGSGSTLIAAERTGRVCRGIEMDPLYVDLTIRRWRRLTGETAYRHDCETFDALEASSMAVAA